MDRTRSLIAFAALLAGCVGSPYEDPARASAPRGEGKPGTAAVAARPEFVGVPSDHRSVEELVREAKQQADREERRLLVYVGATWCEPCQVFHHAVEAGRLDAELAGVRFLEFDSDLDARRLAEAGYGGALIPRFVLPGADGRGTDAKIEGGVKGEAAVGHIMARLADLLSRA